MVIKLKKSNKIGVSTVHCPSCDCDLVGNIYCLDKNELNQLKRMRKCYKCKGELSWDIELFPVSNLN